MREASSISGLPKASARWMRLSRSNDVKSAMAETSRRRPGRLPGRPTPRVTRDSCSASMFVFEWAIC